MGREKGNEVFLGKHASLREAVDAFDNLPNDEVVISQVGHVEVGAVLQGNKFDGKAHVFRAIEDALKVEIRNVHGDMIGVIIADHGIEEALDSGSVNCRATTITIIVREIATDGEADAKDIRAARLGFPRSDNGGIHSRATGRDTRDDMHRLGGENQTETVEFFIEESLLPKGAVRSAQLSGVFTGAR
jgi:hypothetical protein